MTIEYGMWFAVICAIIGILYGVGAVGWILKLPTGNERMREIAAAIQMGAKAYLNRQYRTIAMVGIVLFLLIGFVLKSWPAAIG
ncbi:MAG: sodium/proton-translocating pyrophosphatase, partial [Gammaproteobacteria bacterium]